MKNRQINTPEQFANTLKELSSLLGLEFIIEGYDTYIIVNNERKKMDYFNGLFYTEEGDKVIVFNQKFTPMFLSNSCLIDIYVKDGEDRYYYRLQQELSPAASGSTAELPNITFYEYIKGKSHVFYGNKDHIEMIESDTLITDIYNHIIRFEGLELPTYTKKMDKEYNSFLFGTNSEWHYQNFPICKLKTIKGKKGHSHNLYELFNTMIFNESTCIYNYKRGCNFDLLPFIDSSNRKSIINVSDNVSNDGQIPSQYCDYLLSIIKNKAAISCVNNSVNHFRNSKAWPFIEKYFQSKLEIINQIKKEEKIIEASYIEDVLFSNPEQSKGRIIK